MSWNCLIMLCWIPQSPALFISCQVLKLCVKPSVCFENSVRIVYGSYTQCQECFCGYGGNWFLGISSTREPMVPPKHIIKVKKHKSRVRRGKRMQRIQLKIKKVFWSKISVLNCSSAFFCILLKNRDSVRGKILLHCPQKGIELLE